MKPRKETGFIIISISSFPVLGQAKNFFRKAVIRVCNGFSRQCQDRAIADIGRSSLSCPRMVKIVPDLLPVFENSFLCPDAQLYPYVTRHACPF